MRPAAVLLAETVRLIERDGPLEDQDILREAFRDAAGDEERLLEHGRLLGRRLQLDRELQRWRRAALGIVLLLAVLAFLSAYGTAAAVIGSGRIVNAVTAFFALLALPAFTLLIWVGSLVFRGAGAFGYLSFGNILLRVLARLPGGHRQRTLPMAEAAHSLLERERLLPWAFGVVSHATWALALMLVLVALGFAFSFQAYQLTWETTILDANFFTRFVTLTGTLPALLGFPVPDLATLRDPAVPGADHRAFAWWLMGCVFTYGLLPRCILATVCWAAWRRGVRRLHLDTAEPYYRKLLVRFGEMEASLVEDKEQCVAASEGWKEPKPAIAGHDGVLIGFELPPEMAWPPSPLPLRLAMLERISGTGAERRAVLDRLGAIGPRALLLVCHAASTPDRGTERFLREAARHVSRTALLLAAGAHESDVRRWKEWLEQLHLDGIAFFTDVTPASEWLGGGRG